MKDFRKHIILSILGGLLILAGCSYDVTEPLWDKPYDAPPVPQITSVQPAAADAGVNYITISGTDFLDIYAVYFDVIKTEVISSSQTEVVVRRPPLFGDALEVKVVPQNTEVSAKYASPYKVDRIAFEFGQYVLGYPLEFAITDDAENAYVGYLNTEENSRYLDKITPAGEKTELSVSVRSGPSDIVSGPDGRWYVFYESNRRYIDALDLVNVTLEENWLRLGGGEFPKTGAFDNEDYFYTGGDGTGLQVADPSLNLTQTTHYSEDDLIHLIRVYENNIYLLVEADAPDAETPEWAIWRHTLQGSGALSDRQLFIDLSQNALLAGKDILNMEMSTNGNIFISTDDVNSLIEYDVISNTADYYYKNVLPKSIQRFKWGTANTIYAVVSDSLYIDPDYADPAVKNRFFKIDLGIAGN